MTDGLTFLPNLVFSSTLAFSYEWLEEKPMPEKPRGITHDPSRYFIQVIPNPVYTEAELIYQFDEAWNLAYLTIYDSRGTLRLNQRLDPAKTKMKLPIYDLDSGIYFININTNTGQILQSRFLIIK